MTTWRDDPNCSDSPQSAFTSGLQSSYSASGQLRVYGFTVYSSRASAQFILMFDASGVPADGTVPIIALPVALQNQVSAYYGPMGRVFHRGIVLCNSSTDTTKTIGSADCFFDVQFDNIVR